MGQLHESGVGGGREGRVLSKLAEVCISMCDSPNKFLIWSLYTFENFSQALHSFAIFQFLLLKKTIWKCTTKYCKVTTYASNVLFYHYSLDFNLMIHFSILFQFTLDLAKLLKCFAFHF